VRDAASLRLMIRSEAPRKPAFAVVSPFSSHLILLRQWLHSAGIHPDNDVRIAILPPPLVGEHMREGLIDGFCAGEPWNSAIALGGEGWIIATSASLSPWHPEKILLATTDLMATGEYRALRRALVRACRWCDAPANRDALVDLLHSQFRPLVSREALANSLIGPLNTGVKAQLSASPLHCFHRYEANAATRQRAAWYYDGFVEAGTLPANSTLRHACLNAFREVTP
jgi:two-component system, oxyanion-binding sensor